MKHLITTALFTVGSLALSQMGPRRLMDPAAKKGPDAEKFLHELDQAGYPEKVLIHCEGAYPADKEMLEEVAKKNLNPDGSRLVSQSGDRSIVKGADGVFEEREGGRLLRAGTKETFFAII